MNCNSNFLFTEFRKLKILDNWICSIFTFDRKTSPKSFWHSIWAITPYPHTNNTVCTHIPILQMINNSIGCWEDWTSTPGLKYFSSSFLYFCDEGCLEPLLIDFLADRFAFYFYLGYARVLGCWVVTKNSYAWDIIIRWFCFLRNLAYCTVVVQTAKAAYVFLWDLREMAQDECICICWVCDHNAFHVLFCKFQSFWLNYKNIFVFL